MYRPKIVHFLCFFPDSRNKNTNQYLHGYLRVASRKYSECHPALVIFDSLTCSQHLQKIRLNILNKYRMYIAIMERTTTLHRSVEAKS